MSIQRPLAVPMAWPTARNRTARDNGSPTDARGQRYSVVAEALITVGAALLMVQLSRDIEVNPLDRIGQVSGLAAVGLRFTILAMLIILVMLLAARHCSRGAYRIVGALASAAAAGLATGFVAGGLVVSLRGTTWPLFANQGDAGRLVEWTTGLLAGRATPTSYPPATLHVLAWWSEVVGTTPSSALQTMQVLGAALYGPLAYLAWRLVLPPPWALTIGLTATLPLIDPYKPYVNLVLVVLLPVMVGFLHSLRRCEDLAWKAIVVRGVVFGGLVGLLFITYSGWFVWAALGVIAATLAVLPWRTGAGRGLTLIGVTGGVFAAIAWRHLRDLVQASDTVEDRYFYFDTYVEPAYIAMWRGDLPGDVGPWPPLGEMAGVGLFTILLTIGVGAALALGARRTAVITLSCCLASAWLMRFWFASQMYETQAVQLYTRTTPLILHCLLLLSGLSVFLCVERWKEHRAEASGAPGSMAAGTEQPARAGIVGVLVGFLLLALSVGSSVADRYLPRPDDSVGSLAFWSQLLRQEDGRCSAYTRPDECADDATELRSMLSAQ